MANKSQLNSNYKENMEFEAEVRRVAEALWHLEPGGCQPQHYSDDPIIRELDGLAELRDLTHLLMVTVSRRGDKIRDDVKKLNAAEKVEKRRGVPVVKWLVTREQIDAEHVRHARENHVKIMTLAQFRMHILNGKEYISRRRQAAFGSARDPMTGHITIPDKEYVELPIQQEWRTSTAARKGMPISIKEVVEGLQNGETYVLMAPFGAGKSLTTRQIFYEMAKMHNSDEHYAVPVAINLREHWGQVHADELLERHARSIGFSPKQDLVVAWRVGKIALLIDGFDEVAAQVVARSTNSNFMREARSQALQAVHELVMNTPEGVGVLLAGRDHYFDNEAELVQTLGLHGKRFSILRLGEFTESQANKFLQEHTRAAEALLPDWLPRKPLLLGYLAHRGLLEPILSIDSTKGFGHAWSEFLNLICEREATIKGSVMHPDTLRHVLERLACGVRATSSGTGPITGQKLAEAYQAETSQQPSEGILMQLQRLPGLTQRDQDPGARSFVDEDLLVSLQGSAIARIVLEKSEQRGAPRWLSALRRNGIAMASYLLKQAGADAATVIARARHLAEQAQTFRIDPQIPADLLAVALEMARDDGRLACNQTTIEGASLGEINLEEIVAEDLVINECFVEHIVLGPTSAEGTLRFSMCIIQRISGAASVEGLPGRLFDGCDFSDCQFDDLSTNAAVVRSTLPPRFKALITVLRKLYLQAGGGRELGALRRGLPPGPVQSFVDDVVQILRSEGIISVYNGVAHPVRRQKARIMEILDAPTLSSDPIVVKVRAD